MWLEVRKQPAMIMKGASMLFWKEKVAGVLTGQVQFWAPGLFHHHSVSRCWKNNREHPHPHYNLCALR